VATHRIVSVEMGKLRGRPHETVVSVQTHDERGGVDTHWSLPAVLRAMGVADVFGPGRPLDNLAAWVRATPSG